MKSFTTHWSFDRLQASRMLGVVANPHRLLVLGLLLDEEWDVGTLAKKLKLSQSALSQHLKILRDADLVSTRRDGQMVYYSSTSPEILHLLELLNDDFVAENRQRLIAG
jgi:DNA-binding transcriptional ArsR family regulator